MARHVLILVLIAVTSVLSEDTEVLEYTDADFADKIGDHEVALVEFFAPWCGHCKRLAPEYDKASITLKKNDPPVPLIKVDCTANTETCGKFGVSGYPTLKIFKGGEVASDYNGPRDASGIVSYMRSKAGPSSKTLTSVADLEKFLDNEEHSIVGFFKSAESDIAKQFQKAAEGLSEKFRFAHTTESDVLKKQDYSDDIVIFQPPKLQVKLESTTKKYDGDATLHKIKSWIMDNVHGLAGFRTPSNADQFKQPLVVAYYNADYKLNPKGSNYWRNRVLKVGKKLVEAGRQVNFAVSNKADFAGELEEFGISAPEGDKPVVAAKDSSGKKFVMSEEFTMDAFETFVTAFLDGKLEPYLKSEPIPDNDGPLKTVVAKNFDEIVNDDTKDVLIEFYAPWCGHCKTLAPKYEELAEKLKDEPNIVIAKMDATANDVPSPYEVRGFPTLYFAPKGSKSNPKKYESGREVDDFIKYLAKESTDPMKGYSRKGKKVKEEL
ncbi:LOW QUALITY PROTEIN: protein disulfide-isomerase A3-like [Lingula anatina]|uniref:Protein disulfide-isomerase n=1 Tax=Lingula anatina TaxID=7574 RepID=A0A1S3HV24_LINAN|nr:LOW QUALITY PROTEIN: protein disulfide-isomerase A3-like [Lingula anatina]|eukprot:XP_013389396.1 LOW QUALITY PROTEIN: protein disulfide-isomerase A3-like [Lingula anatina]